MTGRRGAFLRLLPFRGKGAILKLKMNVVIGAKTDPGRRSNNEDQLSVVDVRRHGLRADGVLVIADGMGGRNFGERASAVAVETVQDTLVEMLAAERAAGVDTGEALTSALRKANARVYELGRQSEETQGMGTTCVAVVVQGETLSVAHAGDSRAYLLRDGALERLTDDHSYVAEQVRAGVISEESAQRSRFRNVITRAVGIEPTITPDVSQHPVRPGDVLLLCTDGLTNMVPEDQITRILQQGASPQSTADRLVQIANRNGGKDNITAIVARLEVSNRTQRMRAEELAREGNLHRTQQMGAEDLTALPTPARTAKTVRPVRRAPAAPSVGGGGRARWLWPILTAIVILGLVGVARPLVHLLRRAFVNSVPATSQTAPPAPPDLSHLRYAPPRSFYIKPVQGGLLALNQADGSLTVVTESSQVVRLSPRGSVLYQSPLSAAAALPAVPADGNQHFAADPQGNIYVADTAARTIYRYSADGRQGAIFGPFLKQPSAIAVAADGTLYVIDAERLMVLRPLPPGAPSPRPLAPMGGPLPLPSTVPNFLPAPGGAAPRVTPPASPRHAAPARPGHEVSAPPALP